MKRLLPFLCTLLALTTSIHSNAQTKPHFNHLTVYVTDLYRAANFYRDVLMLDTIPEPFHDNRHVWFRIADHAQLHVVSGAKAMVTHDVNIHLAFTVSSLPAFINHLEKLNIKYGNFTGEDKKIAIRPDQINQIYLQDPDGYWIEVNDDKF